MQHLVAVSDRGFGFLCLHIRKFNKDIDQKQTNKQKPINTDSDVKESQIYRQRPAEHFSVSTQNTHRLKVNTETFCRFIQISTFTSI